MKELRQYDKKMCFCGCDTFEVYQWGERKGDIVFQCIVCKCERKVNTPGVSVKEYCFAPELIDHKKRE
jgi:hypothetical protein